MVLHAGLPLEGMNLYNNGFSGGLLAIILYPTPSWPSPATAKPVITEAEYFDHMEHDEPGDPASSAGHDRGGGLRERPGWKKKMDFPYRTSLQSGMGSI